MRSPKILCVCYGGGHVKACLPVLNLLSKRGWDVEILALTTAFDEARRGGFAPWRALDLIESGDEGILESGRSLAQNMIVNGAIPIEETIAYLGFGFHDLIQDYGPQKARRIFESRGRGAFEPRLMVSRAINRAQPDVLLATNSPRAEKVAIQQAQSLGIPSVMLIDLFASDEHAWLHDPNYADYICVLSEAVRTRLIASGHSDKKVFVTGNPSFEPMLRLRAEREKREGARKRIVLFASQPLPIKDNDVKLSVQRSLLKIASKQPGWEVRARPHPSETPNDYAWIRPPLKRSQDASLYQDLNDADVLITHGSTVGLEAALAGIPVVQILGSAVSEMAPFHELGVATPIQNLDEFEAVISQSLLEGFNSGLKVPEDPTSRVADVIESALKQCQPRKFY